MIKGSDHYALLGVARSASPEAIRAAYLAQVKVHHPDFASTPDAFERFHALQSAYECLRSPDRRARYDLSLAADPSAQWRRVARAHRRLRKLDRLAATRSDPGPVPHWRAAATVALCGCAVLSACYLIWS